MSTSSTATTVPNTGMDRWTTISVLCLAAAYAIWVFCVAYLRLLQYRDTKNTIFRRETCTLLSVAWRSCLPHLRMLQQTRSNLRISLTLAVMSSISSFQETGCMKWSVSIHNAFVQRDLNCTATLLQSPKTQRAFNTVLNQAENFGYFAAAVLANVAIRGPLHGTQEVHSCAGLLAFKSVVQFHMN